MKKRTRVYGYTKTMQRTEAEAQQLVRMGCRTGIPVEESQGLIQQGNNLSKLVNVLLRRRHVEDRPNSYPFRG